MIDLKKVHIMQDGFRLHVNELTQMSEFVLNGGRFNLESLKSYNPERCSLIGINEFEDGEQYIRDGLHRSFIILESRKESVLYDDEYYTEHISYERFNLPNIDNNWFTPFDPKTEVRRSDFWGFKEEVMDLIEADLDRCDIESFILKNKDRYAVPKKSIHKLKLMRLE